MLICNECGAIFDESEMRIIHDDPSPSGVSLAPGYYEYGVCPKCGDDDIDEAERCYLCGEWISKHRNEICMDCEIKLREDYEELIRKHIGIHDFVDTEAFIADYLAERY